MSNLRFYEPQQLHLGNIVTLSGNAATHATRVMRLGVGDSLILFNGDGYDYDCELISIKKSEALVRVKNSTPIQNESPLNITLLQGISSGDRMDYTIQKAVELGIKHIQPIATERSVVKLSQERAEKRVEHWQNIVIAACEQSGRAFVPHVAMPMGLSAWLTNHPSNQTCRILLNPFGAKRFAQINKPSGEIQLLIGAEGGLSNKEIELATANGFQSIILGPRILRTETAALTAIASIHSIWGDL
ncbi:MAG TPA: 16S rRNA (uracil(1498)-N(3))-methyltransferase [Methylophilaceae bacterium]|nr:16S rRNA (uracil(1498)-N(3))-methyltransferase [Methylophilaceae bacterium]HAJ71720.1 16S rRNA (uracil(1498)-N(3))-methyltransferase [Methylophilaceae bacterium]